jgi:phosphoserine phosphatase RsbU/P
MNITKRNRLVLGCAFFALMFIHIGSVGYSTIYRITKTSVRGWDVEIKNGKPAISFVNPEGPATALQIGDEVVALKSERPEAMPIVYFEESSYWLTPAGTGYTLTALRNGEALEIQLQSMRQSNLGFRLAFQVIFLIFAITGLIIFLLKHDDSQALLLALMLSSFVGVTNWQLVGLPIWIHVIVAIARCAGLWFIQFFLHFFLIFPERSPWLRRFPGLEKFLYLPFVLFVAPWFSLQRISEIFPNFFNQTILSWLGGDALLWVVSVYMVLGLVSLFVNYRASAPASRRKLRVVVAGCVAGFLNLVLLVLMGTFGLAQTFPRLRAWLDLSLLLTTPLIPISFAYAIIRHKVIPVSLIIRRSLRYLLVSRGAEILEAIAVGLLVISLFHIVFSHWHVSGEVAGVIATIVAILLWDSTRKLHKRYLAPLIDRRFFRQSYDAHQIIAELTGSLRAVTDLPQLLELVATRLRTALQTEYVTIYLRDPATGSFSNAYSCDYGGANGEAGARLGAGQLTRYAMLVDQLDQLERSLEGSEPIQQGRRPGEIELDAFLSGYDGDAGPIEKRGALREAKATLLMPLYSKDGMLGVISLGPRLGDLPFSREDKQLLMSVSGPTALAIENARLVEQMVAEARRLQEIEVDHRRKTEELAYARQLQLSMLPARNVSLANIEIIGQMRAATEVGGDYYDFIEMADGRICVAVGDATGHGMAAGLVVGMVKMGLINGLQRMNGQASVKQLIEDLNLALKRSLAQRGMGMCLGAAILDSSTLQVEVLSNGMPAPYHYRSAIRSLLPIPTQAPPLGFLRRVNVRPVETRLGPGDALIWLSDGFEERMNQANQVWGSEEVERTLERICDEESSAESIAQRMIEACDGAAGGRSNDDDMTIVVAKVKAG